MSIRIMGKTNSTPRNGLVDVYSFILLAVAAETHGVVATENFTDMVLQAIESLLQVVDKVDAMRNPEHHPLLYGAKKVRLPS